MKNRIQLLDEDNNMNHINADKIVLVKDLTRTQCLVFVENYEKPIVVSNSSNELIRQINQIYERNGLYA